MKENEGLCQRLPWRRGFGAFRQLQGADLGPLSRYRERFCIPCFLLIRVSRSGEHPDKQWASLLHVFKQNVGAGDWMRWAEGPSTAKIQWFWSGWWWELFCMLGLGTERSGHQKIGAGALKINLSMAAFSREWFCVSVSPLKKWLLVYLGYKNFFRSQFWQVIFF